MGTTHNQLNHRLEPLLVASNDNQQPVTNDNVFTFLQYLSYTRFISFSLLPTAYITKKRAVDTFPFDTPFIHKEQYSSG